MPNAPASTPSPVAPHPNRLQRLRRQQWLLGAACIIVVLAAWRAGMLNRLELPTIDLRTQWFNRWAGGPSPDVVVMGIDDRSLGEIGEWPWSRDVMAEAIRELHAAGAKTIALDVIFNSPWNAPPGTTSAPDAALASQIAAHASVVLPFRQSEPATDTSGGSPPPLSVSDLVHDPAARAVLHELPDRLAARRLAEILQAAGRADATPDAVEELLPAVRSIIGAEAHSSVRVDTSVQFRIPSADGQIDVPIPAFTSAAAALGDVAIKKRVAYDADAVYRRLPLWTNIGDDRLWAAFSLAAVAAFLDYTVAELRPRDGTSTTIPTDPPRTIPSRVIKIGDTRYPYVYSITWPRGGRTWAGQFNNPRPGRDAVPHEVPITAALRPMLIRRAAAHNLEALEALLRLATAHNIGNYAHAADLAKQLQGVPFRDDRWASLLEEAATEATAASRAAAQLIELQGDVDITDLPEDQARLYVDQRDIAERIPAILAECRAVRSQTESAESFLRNVVHGKLVFIGWTATSVAADAVKTSLATPQTPGVYIHAAAASSMLTGFERLPVAPWVDGVFVLVMGVGGIAAARRSSVWLAPLLVIALLAAWFLFAGVVLWDAGWRVAAVAAPSVAAVTSWLGVLLHRLLVEQRLRRRTEERFRAYVSPAVVDELVNNPQLDSMTPQRRELSIMFCDVAGFTAIAERLGAEGTAQFLTGYLGKMTDTLLRHGATIDKYLGDGIMAFWGAPIHDPRHARNACRAAAALARAVADFGLRDSGGRGADGPGPLKIRIGLAAGDVMVGDFGNPPVRSSYTVLGDPCNIAARLERACKLLGTTILVSAAVRAAAGEGFLWRPLGKFILQGRLAPEPVFELVGTHMPGGKGVADEQLAGGARPGVAADSVPAWIRATEDAVEAFAAARWPEARERFEALSRDFADEALAQVYLDAIQRRTSGEPINEPLDAIQLSET